MTRTRSFVLLLVAMLAPFAASVPTVGAQADARDLTDDLGSLSDETGLRAAIQSAETETGVDFAVYATDQIIAGDGSLDARLAGQVSAACPSIFESPSNVADNTVLLAVSTGDRHTVVAYGDDLDERLDDDVNDIIGRMNDFFANGEISAGLASGTGSTVQGLSTTPTDLTTPIGAGVLGTAAVVGGGAWIYTKNRTRKSRGAVASERFAENARRVTGVQARWFDAEQEATIVGGRVTGTAMARMNTAQLEAAESSRSLYEAWSPVSEVTADDMAGYSLDDQKEVEGHVAEARSASSRMPKQRWARSSRSSKTYVGSQTRCSNNTASQEIASPLDWTPPKLGRPKAGKLIRAESGWQNWQPHLS